MLSQAGFFVKASEATAEINSELSVDKKNDSPEKILMFNIFYAGSRREEFVLQAGIFIYKDHPHHVRLIDPIPLYARKEPIKINRTLWLLSKRMGIHWDQESGKSYIEISQARFRPDGKWRNTYKATLDELYRGARIKNNGSIERFYEKNGVRLGKRVDLLRNEKEASKRRNYLCCLFDMKDTTETYNIILYTYLLARLRPIYYGYDVENKFLSADLLQ